MSEAENKTPITRIKREYPPVVYQRMRHILMSYRNSWSGKSGKAYDWGALAADIQQASGEITGDYIEFPKNSLENFVRGWRVDDKGNRLKGKPAPSVNYKVEHSTPGKERIDAIICFLTTEKSKGWFCTKAQLLATQNIQAPYFLYEHLAKGNGDTSYLNTDLLAPHYTAYRSCELDQLEAAQPEIASLTIINKLADHYAQVDLVHYRKVTQGNNHALYSGWLVISPEENLMVCVKHADTGENLIYVSHGIENRIYTHQITRYIAMSEFHQPEDGYTLHSDEDTRAFTESAESNLQDGLLIFVNKMID